MKKLLIALVLVFASLNSTVAQYREDFDRYDRDEERFFYNEDFDWRWDVRVRISNGERNGRITRREARRLYDCLEDLEKREYRYISDGYFSGREQDRIWSELSDLHARIGIELNDWDRSFYGYSRPGYAYRGRLGWYGNSIYDFNRFDRWGSISFGYRPRNYYPRPERRYSYHYYRNAKPNNRYGDKHDHNWNKNDRREDDRGRDNRDYGKSRNERYGSLPGDRPEPRGENRPGRDESYASGPRDAGNGNKGSSSRDENVKRGKNNSDRSNNGSEEAVRLPKMNEVPMGDRRRGSEPKYERSENSKNESRGSRRPEKIEDADRIKTERKSRGEN
jgi:hypothetical protein